MSVRQGLPPRRVSTPLSPAAAAADLANPYRLQAGRAANDASHTASPRHTTQSAAAAAAAGAAPPPPPPQRAVPPQPSHHHHSLRASRTHSPTAVAAATPQRRVPSPSPPPPPPAARRQQQYPQTTRDGTKGETKYPPAVQAALERLAQRLSSTEPQPHQPPPPQHRRRFDSVYDLKTWVAHEFDPNRTGTLGVGEFMCVWLWGHAIARKRYHVVGSSSGGGRGGSAVSPARRRDAGGVAAAAATGGSTFYPPSALPFPPAKVAAVAAFLVGRVLKREADLELLDHRTDAEKRRERLWYGGAAAWRWEEPAVGDAGPSGGVATGGDASSNVLLFTHATLLALRRVFEPFQDVQGGVRFGNISAFLHEVNRDATLRGSLHFTHEDVEAVLDTIVRHVELSLPPAPKWVEPSISFMILLSLVLRFSAAAADRAELSALFNEGLSVFNALAGGGTEEVAQLPIRVLLLAVASASPHSFTDTRAEGVDVSAAVLAPTPLKAW